MNGEPSATRAGGRKVLIADDNPDTANILGMLVREMGHDVFTAYGGREAIEAVARHRPDAALLDIGMPDMNGYEAARMIREQANGHAIMLIALTGWGEDDDIERAKAAGFDHHLTKPAGYDAIAQLLGERAGGL